MRLKSVKEELNRFGKYVVSQSRANLTRGNKNVSKELWKSLKYNTKESKNSFEMTIEMLEYGLIQDKGIRGKSSSSRAPKSPYKFGRGTGAKGGLTKNINKWVRDRGIQFRDRKSGRFMSYDTTALLITRSVYNKGIKPSLFFTKPFEKAFKNLNKDLLEAYKLDVEKFMSETINNKGR